MLFASRSIWQLIFAVILICTQIPYVFDLGSHSSIIGIPNWVWYYIGLHLVFVFTLYKYGSTIRQENEL